MMGFMLFFLFIFYFLGQKHLTLLLY